MVRDPNPFFAECCTQTTEHTTTEIPFFVSVYGCTSPALVTELHLPFKTCKTQAILSVRLPRYEQQCPPTSFHSWILKIKMEIHWWQTPGLHRLKVFLSLQELAENPSHENADTFQWTLHRTLWLLGHRSASYPPLCESHTTVVRNNLSTQQLHCFHHTNGFNGKGWSCANSVKKTPGAQHG